MLTTPLQRHQFGSALLSKIGSMADDPTFEGFNLGNADKQLMRVARFNRRHILTTEAIRVDPPLDTIRVAATEVKIDLEATPAQQLRRLIKGEVAVQNFAMAFGNLRHTKVESLLGIMQDLGSFEDLIKCDFRFLSEAEKTTAKANARQLFVELARSQPRFIELLDNRIKSLPSDVAVTMKNVMSEVDPTHYITTRNFKALQMLANAGNKTVIKELRQAFEKADTEFVIGVFDCTSPTIVRECSKMASEGVPGVKEILVEHYVKRDFLYRSNSRQYKEARMRAYNALIPMAQRDRDLAEAIVRQLSSFLDTRKEGCEVGLRLKEIADRGYYWPENKGINLEFIQVTLLMTRNRNRNTNNIVLANAGLGVVKRSILRKNELDKAIDQIGSQRFIEYMTNVGWI